MTVKNLAQPKSIRELYPDFPNSPVDGYKVTVWSVDTERCRRGNEPCITKYTYEYHLNTPHEILYPGSDKYPDYVDLWAVRIDDAKDYSGLLGDGWEKIHNVSYVMYSSRKEAVKAAIRDIDIVRETITDWLTSLINISSGLSKELK
jgi:hypothetical protein